MCADVHHSHAEYIFFRDAESLNSKKFDILLGNSLTLFNSLSIQKNI